MTTEEPGRQGVPLGRTKTWGSSAPTCRIADCQKSHGMIYTQREDWNSAQESLEESLELNSKYNCLLGLAESYHQYGLILKRGGEKQNAAEALMETEKIFMDLRPRRTSEE